MNSKNKLQLKKTLTDYKGQDVIFNDYTSYFTAHFPFFKKGYRAYITKQELTTLVKDIITNLVILNPTSDNDIMINYVKKSIEKRYLNYIDEYSINTMIEESKEMYENNTIKPTNVTKKSYWVNPTVSNKSEVYKDKRSEMSLELISLFFSDDIYYCDEKVVYQTIADNTGLALVTIKRRITDEQKQLIKKHNIAIQSYCLNIIEIKK